MQNTLIYILTDNIFKINNTNHSFRKAIDYQKPSK